MDVIIPRQSDIAGYRVAEASACEIDRALAGEEVRPASCMARIVAAILVLIVIAASLAAHILTH